MVPCASIHTNDNALENAMNPTNGMILICSVHVELSSDFNDGHYNELIFRVVTLVYWLRHCCVAPQRQCIIS